MARKNTQIGRKRPQIDIPLANIELDNKNPRLAEASSHVVKQKIQFLEKKYKYPFQITINTPIASLF